MPRSLACFMLACLSSRSHDPHPKLENFRRRCAFAQLYTMVSFRERERTQAQRDPSFGHFAKEWGAASSLRG